jgi:outer membrane protein
MKTPSLIFTNVALSLMIATGLAACNGNKSETKTAVTTAAAPVDEKAQIVFINQDTLLSQYKYVKDLNARMEGKGKAAQSDLGARGQAFQREAAEYQKNAATMTAEQRAAREQQLQRKNQELLQYRDNTAAQVQNEQATETQKLYEKIAVFVKDYAKDKGYKMVLTYQKGNTTMWYGDPTLDVTSDVVKRLNDAYDKDKK